MKWKLIVVACALNAVFVFGQGSYTVENAFPSLAAFSLPIEMRAAPDNSNRIFIVQQRGIIYVFDNSSSVNTRKIFLNISDRVSQSGNETGLLGLAFHPNYQNNGYFYVNYTNTVGGQLQTFVARYQVSGANPDSAVKSSELILLPFNQPYSNHNGGCLLFGPDGYLYIATGDGGSGGDPQGNGQNRSTLLGKILRIDVNSSSGGLNYSIPTSNPYYGNAQGYRQEIFSYGMRNPWKYSFDGNTGRLWCADVGQSLWEEIDIITNGGNFGWNVMEGAHCYNPSSGCDTTGKIKPVWEYTHSDGNASITGGYVYRGNTIPALVGKYVYADYATGRIWALTYDGINPTTNTLLVDRRQPTAIFISSFGEDESKELYVLSISEGLVYKLKGPPPPNNPPTISKISDLVTLMNTSVSAQCIVHDENVNALTFTASSSNTALIPNANVVVSGSDTTRTVTVTPANNQTGVANITLTVSDGQFSDNTAFKVTVNPPNYPPTISSIPNLTTLQNTPVSANFIVTDEDVNSVTFTASSTDPTLIPDANVVVTGSGTNRTVTVTPINNNIGVTMITLTVSDGSLSANTTFQVTVNRINLAPTISAIPDVITTMNIPASTMFTVTDEDVNALQFTVASSNQTLIPNANVIISNTGTTRTATITPVNNQIGNATITITVSDGLLSANENFRVTVNPVNNPPTISTIPNLTTLKNTPVHTTCTVNDENVNTLTFLVSSSDQTLIPNANVIVSDTGSTRSITITPANDQIGTTTITLGVSDGVYNVNTGFLVTVDAPNNPPTMSAIPNLMTMENIFVSTPITVSDEDVNSLLFTAVSTNTILIPNVNVVVSGTGASRTVTIIPATNQVGTSSVTLTVSDGIGSASTTFQVKVNPANKAPTISSFQNLTTMQNTSVSANFLVSDENVATLSFTSTSSNTTLIPNTNLVITGNDSSRTVTITPAHNQIGISTITITVSDGALSASRSFDLTVNPIIYPPNLTNVSTVRLLKADSVPGTRDVQFDVAWKNSWRTLTGGANRDAVWVFMKYRENSGAWHHATLSTNTADYQVGGMNGVSATFTPSPDGKGVFIYRSTEGFGAIRWQDVRLRWNYAQDSVKNISSAEVKVFAIEMVYIPQGSFLIGDGSSPGRFHAGANPNLPYLITDKAPQFSNTSGGLWADTARSVLPSGGLAPYPFDNASGSLPNFFPTGYGPFYMMKHEVPEGLYAEFLNTITPAQAQNLFPTSSDFANAPACVPCRFAIDLDLRNSYATSAPTRAMNWMNWEDGLAFADWAALRPMTELEFEKACRGTNQQAVANEYAWGTTKIVSMTGMQGIDGSGSETVTPTDANTLFNKTIQGPVRVGIHDGKATRELMGASYYGVSDLSGNVTEMAITIGNAIGRSFTGAHGDGELHAAGSPNVNGWPRITNPAAAQIPNGGWGLRGGDFWNPELDLRTSARNVATFAGARRLFGLGFRAVRTAGPIVPPTSVPDHDELQPQSLRLEQNYPNPFVERTNIRYQLSAGSHVSLDVYDILGKKVASLVKERQDAGSHSIEWNATDLRNGMYFCVLRAGSTTITRVMTVIK